MAKPLRSDILRIASELPVGDPTRRSLLAALKEAGEIQHFWKIVDRKGYAKLIRALSDDGQSVDLLRNCIFALQERLKLSSNEGAALNRLLNGISRASSWDEETHRNNLFKIANLLGLKLPRGTF